MLLLSVSELPVYPFLHCWCRKHLFDFSGRIDFPILRTYGNKNMKPLPQRVLISICPFLFSSYQRLVRWLRRILRLKPRQNDVIHLPSIHEISHKGETIYMQTMQRRIRGETAVAFSSWAEATSQRRDRQWITDYFFYFGGIYVQLGPVHQRSDIDICMG